MLGSSRLPAGQAGVVVNSFGTLLDDSDFYPFGGEHAFTSSSGNTYKFTGKERDPGASKLQTATGDWQEKLKSIFEKAKTSRGHAHRFRDTLP